MEAILQQKNDHLITRMNNFLKWYARLNNVNPITNEKFDVILERMKNQQQVV